MDDMSWLSRLTLQMSAARDMYALIGTLTVLDGLFLQEPLGHSPFLVVPNVLTHTSMAIHFQSSVILCETIKQQFVGVWWNTYEIFIKGWTQFL